MNNNTLSIKTRNGTASQGKQRVLYVANSIDFVLYFERISDDILNASDCAIYYQKDFMESDDTQEEDLLILNQMQLIVFPVTTNFLMLESSAKTKVLQYAKENHIALLPIMQEEGLDTLFAQECGDIQYLTRIQKDTTALPFEHRLSTFLSSVLASQKDEERIRKEFAAYIFMSYRKKDRKHAQRLMQLIHENDFCRDIAIWYDEYLVPGEDYNENIQDALMKSDLFALAVTPNLVNEENYVMSQEYPSALQQNKKILPIEMVPTEYEKLVEFYKNIPDIIDVNNVDQLTNILKANLVLKETPTSDEHVFLIGLAYFLGIDVEINKEKGLSLISQAADNQYEEAIRYLISVYRNGMGVPKDMDRANEYQERYLHIREHCYNQEPTQESFQLLLQTCDEYVEYIKNSYQPDLEPIIDMYFRMLRYLNAAPQEWEILPIRCRILNAIGDFYSTILYDREYPFAYYTIAYEYVDKRRVENRVDDLLLKANILEKTYIAHSKQLFMNEEDKHKRIRETCDRYKKVMNQLVEAETTNKEEELRIYDTIIRFAKILLDGKEKLTFWYIPFLKTYLKMNKLFSSQREEYDISLYRILADSYDIYVTLFQNPLSKAELEDTLDQTSEQHLGCPLEDFLENAVNSSVALKEAYLEVKEDKEVQWGIFDIYVDRAMYLNYKHDYIAAAKYAKKGLKAILPVMKGYLNRGENLPNKKERLEKYYQAYAIYIHRDIREKNWENVYNILADIFFTLPVLNLRDSSEFSFVQNLFEMKDMSEWEVYMDTYMDSQRKLLKETTDREERTNVFYQLFDDSYSVRRLMYELNDQEEKEELCIETWINEVKKHKDIIDELPFDFCMSNILFEKLHFLLQMQKDKDSILATAIELIPYAERMYQRKQSYIRQAMLAEAKLWYCFGVGNVDKNTAISYAKETNEIFANLVSKDSTERYYQIMYQNSEYACQIYNIPTVKKTNPNHEERVKQIKNRYDAQIEYLNDSCLYEGLDPKDAYTIIGMTCFKNGLIRLKDFYYQKAREHDDTLEFLDSTLYNDFDEYEKYRILLKLD